VDTVDRFQGGEREVIILSLSRSDGVTSFLADKKRLNVSLSRARSKLILLGYGPMLEEHPLFASVLEGVKRVRMCPKCSL
jgi:DNA replication ATP-dependent helicase Dna2